MLDKIEPIILSAASLVVDYQKKITNLNVKEKKDAGVFSEADTESEKLILNGIKSIFPTHLIISEEDVFKRDLNLNDINNEDVWLVDPIDGTNNYLAGFDHYSISIAYLKNQKLMFSIVMKPNSGDFYFAENSQGAYKRSMDKAETKLNGPNLNESQENLSLITCLCRLSKNNYKLEQFARANEHCRSVRRLGSAALDLCLVAEGIFDGFWETHLMPWDIAGGGLICQEAGLSVHNFNSDSFSPFGFGVIARRDSDLELFQKIIS